MKARLSFHRPLLVRLLHGRLHDLQEERILCVGALTEASRRLVTAMARLGPSFEEAAESCQRFADAFRVLEASGALDTYRPRRKGQR